MGDVQFANFITPRFNIAIGIYIMQIIIAIKNVRHCGTFLKLQAALELVNTHSTFRGTF